MKRRRRKPAAAPPAEPTWIAGQDPAERQALRAELDAAWPHPRGTAVVVRPRGKEPVPTRTRSVSFFTSRRVASCYVEDLQGPVPVRQIRVTR